MALAVDFFVDVYHREGGTLRRGRRTPVQSMSMAKMLAADLAKVFGGAEAIRVTLDADTADIHATSVLVRYGDVPTTSKAMTGSLQPASRGTLDALAGRT